jgi:beta-galactosidase
MTVAEAYPYGKFIFASEYDPFIYSHEQWQVHCQWLANCGINQVHFGRGMWSLLDALSAGELVDKCLEFADMVSQHGMTVVVSAGTDRIPCQQSAKWQSSLKGYPTAYREARSQWLAPLYSALAKHPACTGWSVSAESVFAAMQATRADGVKAFQAWLKEHFGSIEEFNRQLFPHRWADWRGQWDSVAIPASADPLPLHLAYGSYIKQAQHAAIAAILEDGLALADTSVLFSPYTVPAINSKQLLLNNWMVAKDLNSDAAHLQALLPPVTAGQTHSQPFLLRLHSDNASELAQLQADPKRLCLLIWRAYLAGAQGVLWPQMLGSNGGESQSLALLPLRRAEAASQTHLIHTCKEWTQSKPCPSTVLTECALLCPACENADLTIAPVADSAVLLEDYRQAFRSLGIRHTPIDTSVDFGQFKAIFAPLLPMVDASLLERLIAFVEKGGLLVTGFECGKWNSRGAPLDDNLLALWERLTGLSVSISLSYPEAEGLSIKMLDGRLVKAGYRCESLALDGAVAMATYSNGPFADGAALAVNSLGRGKVFYLGMRPKSSFYRYALADLADQLDLRRPAFEAGEGVEMIEIHAQDAHYYVLTNTSAEAVVLDWKAIRGTDLFTGKACRGRTGLAAADTIWLRVD